MVTPCGRPGKRSSTRSFARCACTGARELLGYLRQHRVTVVLATSGKPEHVAHYLDLLGGREVADEVVTAEDANASKPAPDLVSAALDRVDASSAVMVGDSVWDVRAAAAVGVPTVCVRSGGSSVGELRDAGAATVVDDLPAVQRHWATLELSPSYGVRAP